MYAPLEPSIILALLNSQPLCTNLEIGELQPLPTEGHFLEVSFTLNIPNKEQLLEDLKVYNQSLRDIKRVHNENMIVIQNGHTRRN